MATGVTPLSHVPRSTFPVGLPFASKRRAALVRDSGAFLAARPVAGGPTPATPRSTAQPRIAATANLATPDAAPRDFGLGTPRRDALMLALAFAIGIGGSVVVLVLRAIV